MTTKKRSRSKRQPNSQGSDEGLDRAMRAVRAAEFGRNLGPEFERIVGQIPGYFRTNMSIYLDGRLQAALRFVSEKTKITVQDLAREGFELVVAKYAAKVSRGSGRGTESGAKRAAKGGAKRESKAGAVQDSVSGGPEQERPAQA